MTDDNRPVLKIGPDHFEEVRDNTHILYRCYNKATRLLYVGMTNHLENRIKNHRAGKVWWKYVDHLTFQQFRSRGELARAEADAIEKESPKFNIVQPLTAPDGSSRGHRACQLWPEASRFCTIMPEYELLVTQSLEQQLFPCVVCHARAIYCEAGADTVACELCATEWTYDQWFSLNFPGLAA